MFSSKRAEMYRGIKDGRWTTKDKLDQYRGILKLYEREKKLKSQHAVKTNKRISLQLGSFREDVRKYRRIVSETVNGIAKSRTYNLLHDRKDLQLKCKGRKTEYIYDSIYEENHRKRRQLDKLRYEKKRKIKRSFQLQLQHAELLNDYAQEQEEPWAQEQTQQQLVTRYQRSIAKQNAAKAINITYASMLGILKKDAVHHEALLNALKQDQQSQSEIIYKTTIIGQLATEESDDIGDKRKRITEKVWDNMKEREHALAFVRGQVQDLWSFAQSLIRTESETMFTVEITRAATASNLTIEKQIKSLEDIFDKVKESLLVRSYRELLSRLEDQTKQRTRLLEQFDRNVKERDSLLSQKNDALSTLSEVEHSLIANAEEHNADKSILLEQIAIQKEREFEQKKWRKVHGELLMDIRAALQTMVAMLVCVRRGGGVEEKDDTDEMDEMDEIPLPIIDKMETEGLTLLSTVSRKVGALFGMSNFEFDKDREQRAKDLYQTYVSDYHSRLKYDDLKLEPTGLFVEHEVIDSSIPTRAEIKLRSRRAVETYLQLE
ncbi:uncharacterized protein LOC122395110 [Colletes gigas]|uniref:uncharacterized protein LOC122395110 n=1 Tax=Colletes gigas TaxID=935657 RepID=UPI001C9AD44D|nr:uncharacterized protein LOC122395110 [Colletes gigas]